LSPKKITRYAVYFNGVNAYGVIEPFTVYNWSEITIIDYIYPFYPKPNIYWSRTSMIGDIWTDGPATRLTTDDKFDYTYLDIRWDVRRPDGAKVYYSHNIFAWRNSWVQVVRRFDASRQLSFWVNAEIKYTITIPNYEITVLEWNPDTATYPERYKRFVLSASPLLSGQMKVSYDYLLIYDRALSESEIFNIYKTPNDPPRNGLKVWLYADPSFVYDIDNDGVIEWIDLSGNGNHCKLYNAYVVELIKPPKR
jgi:hypothetical protein